MRAASIDSRANERLDLVAGDHRAVGQSHVGSFPVRATDLADCCPRLELDAVLPMQIGENPRRSQPSAQKETAMPYAV
jgi:hypothetical protein